MGERNAGAAEKVQVGRRRWGHLEERRLWLVHRSPFVLISLGEGAAWNPGMGVGPVSGPTYPSGQMLLCSEQTGPRTWWPYYWPQKITGEKVPSSPGDYQSH